jgi:hypothetical protein
VIDCRRDTQRLRFDVAPAPGYPAFFEQQGFSRFNPEGEAAVPADNISRRELVKN